MNTPTLVASLIMAAVLAALVLLLIRAMMRGWLRRAQRQAELIGELPTVPVDPGPVTVEPTTGLYVGSTLAEPDALRAGGTSPDWLERVTVGDLGYRAKAVLIRYPDGILLERSGARPIWIPEPSITAIRTERGIAGKVVPGRWSGASGGRGPAHGGILAIRWRLPSGTEIDTGFCGDDRRKYAQWIGRAS
jgi:hypothetical protein